MKYELEVKQLVTDVAAYFQARFTADPDLLEIHLSNQELCDALYAAGVRLIFSDNMVSKYLTKAGYRKERNKWIFRRRA